MAGKARIARVSGVERGERGGVGLTEQDRAFRAEKGNEGGVFPPLAAGVERRAVFGGEAGCLEDIFGAEGDTVERAGAGGGLRVHFDPGADFGVEFGDAAEAGVDGEGG